MYLDPDTVPEVWPKGCTSPDIAVWALARVGRMLAQWQIADLDRHAEDMQIAANGIRTVATRMEQYRRTRIKQWTAAASAQTKPEKIRK